MHKKVVPHNPRWKDAFQAEATLLQHTLGDAIVAIHHIGSTAVPDILAKPIIDILIEVHSLEDMDQRAQHMENAGYEAMGEYGITGRRYFRKSNTAGVRTHHIHTFTAGDKHALRHLTFRDYLLAHPDKAQAYSDLKQTLSDKHGQLAQGYQDLKSPFVEATQQAALRWLGEQKQPNRQ